MEYDIPERNLDNFTTKLRFGFRSKNQLPLFMLWREYLINGKVFWAEILFKLGN